MSEKLLPGVIYTRQKRVRNNFCEHAVNNVLPHALSVGPTTICVECLFERLQEVMYVGQTSVMRWCATCQRQRQTENGVCLSCGGKDLRD